MPRGAIALLCRRWLNVDEGDSPSDVMLDFGPASVDGWLSDIAAAELGVHHGQELLDVEARELVLENGRVALTPLEFGVMHYLIMRQGKAVSLSELLQDVWGTCYEGGSNVVDAVVRSVRRKTQVGQPSGASRNRDRRRVSAQTTLGR